jgi:hypothetical protein
MSSIDAGTNLSRAEASISRAVASPWRQRPLIGSIGSILGGFLLTGFFLGLSAAAFPVAAVYSFIWWAQH